MFNSTNAILNQYIDHASRYNINSVQMKRGENPEDLYYLCNIDATWYVIIETDYINSLAQMAKEATTLFASQITKPLYWLAKKHHTTRDATRPLDTSVDTKEQRNALILQPKESYLKYAVIEIESDEAPDNQHNPNTYGHVESSKSSSRS